MTALAPTLSFCRACWSSLRPSGTKRSHSTRDILACAHNSVVELQAIIRAVCVIIDAFHFDLPAPSAAAEPAAVAVTNGGAALVAQLGEEPPAAAQRASDLGDEAASPVRADLYHSY